MTVKSMMTIGHVFIPLDREHDGMVPTDDDHQHFESLPVPLALWEPFQQCLSKHLSELTEGQIDREEKFCFDATHVNAMMPWWRRRQSPLRRTCATGSCRLRLSLVAPLIAMWVLFLLFLECREGRPSPFEKAIAMTPASRLTHGS